MIESIWQDLKHGVRMLVKNPGFTLIAVASIAIGVGANAAMFSLADGLVLRPLQVPRAGEIVAVSARAPRANQSFGSNRLVSYADYVDLRDRAQGFEGLLAYAVRVVSFATSREQPAQSRLGLIVSGNYSWLNWLTVVLALTTFTDPVLAHVLPLTTPAVVPRPALLGRAIRPIRCGHGISVAG